MKKLIVILTIVLLPSLSFASFTVRLENNFERKMYYFLYWIDHPYGWRTPANMAGGELEASESTQLGANYESGKYRVIWKDKDQWQNEMLISVKKDVTAIIIRPEKIEF
jgi:hypothetical protein